MRSPWRRVAGGILSFLVLLAACSESDTQFGPVDAANEAAAETGPDESDRADARVNADAGPADTTPDLSTDLVVDVKLDTVDDADNTEVGADTDLPDAPPPDASDDKTSIDVTGIDEFADVVSEPAIDADDAGRDVFSEDAGMCASHCASGVCDINGDCKPCIKDDECTGGSVCNTGTCGPRCGDGGVVCTGNLVCCSEHCVDTTRDPQHCGACGSTCSSAQFCGNASTPACRDNVLRNVCNTKKATFLLDGLSDDDASSGVLEDAISRLCVPRPVLTSVNQSTSVAINNTTGQPLVGGGELLVATGGDSTQLLVKYLETSRTSPVYNETVGATQFDWKRRGGAADGGDAVIKTVTLSTITPTHDYFLAEVVKDPQSGTFSLVVYGIGGPGTRAGAFYFGNVMLPNIVGADVTTVTQVWYLYEWTSTGPPDAGPSMADTFMQIDSGM